MSEIGNWQVDSLWQAYMAKVSNSASTLPSATGMVVEPAVVDLDVSAQASLTARGVSSKFPSMCLLPPVSWSTDSLNGVARSAMPRRTRSSITGRKAGTGTLKASASGYSAQATIKVVGGVNPDAGPPPERPDAGPPPVRPDAGPPPERPDAGPPPERPDAGPPPVRPDAGPPPVRPDAGPPPVRPDAGPPPVRPDAGPEPHGGGGVFGSCGTSTGLAAFLTPLVGAALRRRRRPPHQ